MHAYAYAPTATEEADKQRVATIFMATATAQGRTQDVLMRCFGNRHAFTPYATTMKSMRMRRRVKMRKKFNEQEAADAYELHMHTYNYQIH